MDDWRGTAPYVIALGRIAFGLGLMTAPTLGARAYLGSEASRPSVRFMSRIFAVRDLALGLVLLRALHSERREDVSRALWLGAGCDAWDAVSALRSDGLKWWGRFVVGSMGLTFAGLGAAAALAPPPEDLADTTADTPTA